MAMYNYARSVKNSSSLVLGGMYNSSTLVLGVNNHMPESIQLFNTRLGVGTTLTPVPVKPHEYKVAVLWLHKWTSLLYHPRNYISPSVDTIKMSIWSHSTTITCTCVYGGKQSSEHSD